MKLLPTVAAVLIAAGLGIPDRSWAQEPVKSFDQLNTRLKVGDSIWITDARGQEVRGRIQSLRADALALDTEVPSWFSGRDVNLIRETRPDSLWNGLFIGLGVGGGLASAWCLAAAADHSSHGSTGVECAEGFIVYGGVGALLGLAIDAAVVGRGPVVYRAPGSSGAADHARVSIAPMITSRTKSVAVAWSF